MSIGNPMTMSLGEFIAMNHGYARAKMGKSVRPPNAEEFNRAVLGTVH